MQTKAVEVGQWAQHEEFGVYPVGSKPKRMLICPQEPPEPDLIPNHAYLFKTAGDWRVHQIWSEFIAYHLGALAGISVPRCFIGVDEKTGEMGALIEFFFGYPGEAVNARLVHGIDILKLLNANRVTDRPHSVRSNIRLCNVFRIPAAAAWWCKLITFDALIGNTDRHPENWGLLARTPVEASQSYRRSTMEPALDTRFRSRGWPR